MFKKYILKQSVLKKVKAKKPKKEKGTMPKYTGKDGKFLGPKKSEKTAEQKRIRNRRKRGK